MKTILSASPRLAFALGGVMQVTQDLDKDVKSMAQHIQKLS